MIIIFRFDNFQGIGDNIRGLITILQIKKILNFELNIDFCNHVFNQYLVNNYISINSQIEKTYLFYNENINNNFLVNEINELSKNYNVISIYTNSFPIIDEIDNDIKVYIKKLLILKPEIEEYIKLKLYELPPIFNLFHYRVGDNILINNNIENNSLYVENFLKNIKKNAVIISDSLSFKKELFDLYNNKDVYVFLNKPYHTKIQSDIDTIVDFFLIKNAKAVYCYSNYRWISNFVLWTSIIYDISLFDIKE